MTTQSSLPFTIHIDGNIGAGKSTLLELLAPALGAVVAREPVSQWQKVTDSEGKNILARFYEDPSKYAALFQLYAFITRLNELRSSREEAQKQGALLISERSIHTDKHIFATNAAANKLMTELEFKVYCDVYKTWLGLFPLDKSRELAIYVRTPPELCKERVERRARHEEKTKVSLEYLKQLHECHEKWLGDRGDVLVIDGHEDFRKPGFIEALAAKIKSHVETMTKVEQ